MRVFLFSLELLSETFLIPRRNERDIINLNFLNRLKKNTQMPDFMKICPVGAEKFHEDGTERRSGAQTDTTKLIMAFHNFANAPKLIVLLPQNDT
jgi:hypothetical protein